MRYLLVVVLLAISAFAQNYGTPHFEAISPIAMTIHAGNWMIDLEPYACIPGPFTFYDPSGDAALSVSEGGSLCVDGMEGPIYLGSFGNGLFVWNQKGQVKNIVTWDTHDRVREFKYGVQ